MVEPNSIVRICINVPFTNSYRDITLFDSEEEQKTYFTNRTLRTVQRCTFVRQTKTIRVEIPYNDIYNANYICFQNTSYGSKWFYAFITQMEYVNDSTTEIYFELDVIQTWNQNMVWHQSFIQREHIVGDVIGQNLVPENLEYGDYLARDFDGTNLLGNKVIVVASTFDGDFQDVAGGMYAGIYSGLKYNLFSSAENANAFIDRAVELQKDAGIVAIFMLPYIFTTSEGGSVNSLTVSKEKNLTDIDGYVPKNNKLFTYPYNFLYVTNLEGNSAEFKYEYFNSSKCEFLLTGDMTASATAILAPKDYKGVPINYNEKITLTGWSQCAYNTDAFKAWLAQNASSGAIQSLSAGMAVAGSVATGNPIGLFGATMTVGNILSNMYNAHMQPPQSHGAQGSSTNEAVGIKDFAFMHTNIRAEFAKIIDNYFSMYGYATHQVKMPNLKTREVWNYVKTMNCCITGNIPPNDLVKIREIYDNGVTIWHNPNLVGTYSMNNPDRS